MNAKQAFNEMPAEVLNKLSTEISNIVGTPEEISALQQECASLKNQLNQAKAQIETLKALATGSSDKKPDMVNPTAGDKRKFDVVQAKKAKAAPPKVSPQPQATAKANGFKIASTGDPPSDSDCDDDDESDDD